MLRSFETAFGFLTVFRVPVDPPPTMGDVGRSATAFPLVGMFLGLVLLIAWWFLADHFPPIVAAVLVVALWVVLTGGLHLDGWTDCCDALATALPPERRFEILKDSRLGAFGALGLFLLLVLKIGAVAYDALPASMLFLAPVAGRATLVLAASSARHSGQGMAAEFIWGMSHNSVLAAGIILGVCALFAGWAGIVAAGLSYAAVMAFRRMAEDRLGAVNGDVLGACCEIAEVVVLTVACWRW
ncbi:MAG: adenosylcobinamide-GDP ribazoletransferase [Desulfomonile sp.]|nr:adenosylcobinamide-GDP ribazoletransferase [Desulfomonile sp.]